MAWSITGNIRGPQGASGAKGDKGDTGSSGASGVPGASGAQGPTGSQGIQGQAGVSLDINGTVAAYSNLPSNPNPGDAYVVAADGLLYFYDGTSWPANGAGVPFQGPQGPTGSQGIQGASGIPGGTGASGASGVPGQNGSDGARGSRWFTGAGSPSGVTGAVAGDIFLDTGTGDVYVLA